MNDKNSHQQAEDITRANNNLNDEMGKSLTANQVAPTQSSLGGGGRADDYSDHPEDSFDDEEEYSEYGSEYETDEDGEDENNNYDDDHDDGEDPPLSLEELLYSASSYHAIIQPVASTMILAALASVYINDDASRAMGAEQFASAYNVWTVDSDNGVGGNLLASVGNTLVMVCVIGAMTFGIVLLYKYR